MSRLRVSAISFLNTAPLMWDFDHGPLRREYEVDYTLPSVCAEMLSAGTADIGIIPVAAYGSIPDLLVIPDIAIAARGPVRSILLVSKVPVEQIKSVALDTSSRTSVALLEILFRKGWLAPRTTLPIFSPQVPNLDSMLAANDAALLIGDPALTVDRAKYHTVDLAEAWHSATGKPFVFAFWAVRRAAIAEHADPAQFAAIFQHSRDHGLAHLDEIAREWAPRVGISEAEVRDYLSRNIDLTFGEANQARLELFFHLAHEFGLIPQIQALEFLSAGLGATPAAKAKSLLAL